MSVFYQVFDDALFVFFFRLEVEVFAEDSYFSFPIYFYLSFIFVLHKLHQFRNIGAAHIRSQRDGSIDRNGGLIGLLLMDPSTWTLVSSITKWSTFYLHFSQRHLQCS